MLRCVHVFFAWGQSIRAHRARASRVWSARRQNRKGQFFRFWLQLRQSIHMQAASVRLRPLRRALRSWRGRVQELQAERMELVAHGLLLHDQRLAAGGFRRWREHLLFMRDFRRKAGSLARSLRGVAARQVVGAQRRGLERWWGFVQGCRAHELELCKARVFRGWLQCCSEQIHRRSLRQLCDHYREVRSLRKAIASWRAGCERLARVADAVLLWTAQAATRKAVWLFRVWRYRARRQQEHRGAALALAARRASRVLREWHCALAMRLAHSGVYEVVQLERARSWLRAWLAVARASAARRLHDEVASSAVRHSRCRRWIDRWREAGKLDRLQQVAEAWDDTSACRRRRPLTSRSFSCRLPIIIPDGARFFGIIKVTLNIRIYIRDS